MRILLVDDDPLSRESISSFLQNYLNHDVVEAENSKIGYEYYEKSFFPIIISDIRMPGMSGIGLLEKIKEHPRGSSTEMVMITGFGDVKTSIQALRKGAFDYMLKPIDVEELSLIIDKISEKQRLVAENDDLKKDLDNKIKESTKELEHKLKQYQSAYSEVMGLGPVGIFSDQIKRIESLCEKFHKDRDIPVLIEGETGTGKEVFSHMIHYFKNRDQEQGPLITLNCSAISPTLFESELFGYDEGAFTGARKKGAPGKLELAQGGTLFLDEIGDLPLSMQPKLLRVLQDKTMYRISGTKPVNLDVRFIFATNHDLQKKIKEGTFRKDLYYRINTGSIYLPPLRKRRDDIIPLANMFLSHFTKIKGSKPRILSKDAVTYLEEYNWPGNVRELKNAIERLILLTDDSHINKDHLKFLSNNEELDDIDERSLVLHFPHDGLDFKEIELAVFRKVLYLVGDNKSKAAQFLNISRNTIYNKLKEEDN